MDLALRRYRLGRSPTGEPFAVAHERPGQAVMLKGARDGLRAELSRDYRREYGRVASSSAIADALTALEGEAHSLPPEPLHLRVAESDGTTYLDLARPDGLVVAIHDNGWRVEPGGAVLFRRSPLTAALPTPERGGSIDELRSLLNVTDADWPLLVGWMVSAFWPDIPHPILLLSAEQGCGKSTAAKMIVGVSDASNVPLQAPPRDTESWAMMATGSWGVVIDNLSVIQPWFSDALCRAVTGDGVVRRKLYTDCDLSVLNIRTMVVITSIDVGALKGDLGDRLMVVELGRIDPARRLTEAALHEQFARLHPRILGGLLDLVVAVRRSLPLVSAESHPRLADFGRLLAALDLVRGSTALLRFSAQPELLAHDVVESDPVGGAVVELMRAQSEWTGTTQNLLERLRQLPDYQAILPKSARGLSGILRRMAAALRHLGIEIVFPDSKARPRLLYLRRIAPSSDAP